jgi:hypothetical protein
LIIDRLNHMPVISARYCDESELLGITVPFCILR